MLEHVRNGVVDGPEQLQHVFGLLIKQRFVDLGEVAGLQGVEWGRVLDELPELPQQGFALHDGLVDGPVVGGQDLGGDKGVSVPLLLAVLLVPAAVGGPRGGAGPGEGERYALALGGLVLFVGRVVRGGGDGLELGHDDIL